MSTAGAKPPGKEGSGKEIPEISTLAWAKKLAPILEELRKSGFKGPGIKNLGDELTLLAQSYREKYANPVIGKFQSDEAKHVEITEILMKLQKILPPVTKAKPVDIPFAPPYIWNNYDKVGSMRELTQLIKEIRQKKKKLRVLGAGHAPKESSVENAEAQIILVGEFRDMKIEHLPCGDNGEPVPCVRAGGGMHINFDPRDPTSNDKNGLCSQLDEKGYAINDMGGITHQTVSGFLLTGASGGSQKYAYYEKIAAIELVDGTGTPRIFTNPAYPHYRPAGAIPGPGFFCVGVSMGLMGVVTHVTFVLDKHYYVKGNEVFMPGDSANSAIGFVNGVCNFDAMSLKHDYLRLTWGRSPNANDLLQWTGNRTSEKPPLKSKKRYKEFLPYDVAGMVGLQLARMYPDLAGYIKTGFLYKKKPQDFWDLWYKILPMDETVDDQAFWADFTELWIPIAFAGDAVQMIEDALAKDQEMYGNFAIEIYAGKESPFFMGMSHGGNVMRIDIYWYHWNVQLNNIGLEDARYQFYKKYWDVLLRIPGCRCHWGKYMPRPGDTIAGRKYDRAWLEEMYGPGYATWLGVRKALDPDGIFLTDYWKNQLFIDPTLEVGIEILSITEEINETET